MELFDVVIAVVCVAAAVIAVVTLAQASRLYDSIGRSGGFWLSHDGQSSARSPDVAGEQDDEDVRQLLEAISAARRRRGQPPLAPEVLEQVRREALGAHWRGGIDGPERRPNDTQGTGKAQPGAETTEVEWRRDEVQRGSDGVQVDRKRD